MNMNAEKKRRYQEFYMDVAVRASLMSWAVRRKVGCVIEKHGNIISIGWNGMPPGMDNCCEYEEVYAESEYGVGTRWVKTGNLITRPEVSHAEENAVAKLAKSNQSSEGATAYVTLEPCMHCAKLLYSSGIASVVVKERYRSTEGTDYLKSRGVNVEFL